MVLIIYKSKNKKLKTKVVKNLGALSSKYLYAYRTAFEICSLYPDFVIKLILTLNKRRIEKIVRDIDKYDCDLMGILVYKGSVYFEFEKQNKQNYFHGTINKKGKILPTFNSSKKANDLKHLCEYSKTLQNFYPTDVFKDFFESFKK